MMVLAEIGFRWCSWMKLDFDENGLDESGLDKNIFLMKVVF